MKAYTRKVAAAAGVGGLMLAAWLLTRDGVLPAAQAQERGKPDARPNRSVMEVGPSREGRSAADPVKIPFKVWGRRTTHSDDTAKRTVRISVGNSAAVLTAESVAEFVKFAAAVEAKRKDLRAQKPAETVVVRWDAKDVDGRDFRLWCSVPDGDWVFDESPEMPGLASVFEQALRDIEGISANKAVVPW